MPKIVGVIERLPRLEWGTYSSQDPTFRAKQRMGLFSRPASQNPLLSSLERPGAINPELRGLQLAGMGVRFQFGAGCGGGMLQDALRFTVLELHVQERPQFILACGALFPWGLPQKPSGHVGIWPEIEEMDPRFGDGYCRFFPLERHIHVLQRQTFDVILYSDDIFLKRLRVAEESTDPEAWAEITVYLYGTSTREVQ